MDELVRDEVICDYGCETPAHYKMTSGKWCCSDHYNKCPGKRKKQSEKTKGKPQVSDIIKIENIEGILCDYGCGLKAKYKFGSEKLCCSESYSTCPGVKVRQIEGMSKADLSIKYVKIENPEGILCDYGCERKAKYQFGNGKLCCSENHKSCPVSCENHSEIMKGKDLSPKAILIENIDGILCDYGCGLKAKYQFDNKKLCCSETHNKCPAIGKKRGESNKGKTHTEETKLKISEINTGRKCSDETKKKLSEFNTGKTHTEETRNKISKLQTFSLEDWGKKHPLLLKEEELRENPETGEIQAHCKNHNCKNSLENGGWFTPLRNNISNRVNAIENGSGGGYLYCSETCKHICPLYHMISDPNETFDINNIPLESEKGIWRQEVLKRQFDELGYNECEYCGNRELKKLSVHHEKPQKSHSIMSLDPDNGIIACGPKANNFCHMIHGHATGTECSTGNLANLICTKKEIVDYGIRTNY